MDLKNDEPPVSIDVGRRTTQLNLWIIVALVLFVLIGGFLIFRVLRNPPDSTQEMKQGWVPKHARWTSSLC